MNKVTQSIYKNAVDKAFFDNKGNLLVDKGTGTTGEGIALQLEFSKWYLMGDNLSLEVAGYYTSNISANAILVSFELPEYISPVEVSVTVSVVVSYVYPFPIST